MKKSILVASAFSLLLLSCSKSDDKTPPVTTINAKLSVSFPSSVVLIDSMQTTYKNDAGTLVTATVMNANSWESPAMNYIAGKTAYGMVKAYGKVVGTGSVISFLSLTNTATQGVIVAGGNSQKGTTTFTFSGEVTHTF